MSRGNPEFGKISPSNVQKTPYGHRGTHHLAMSNKICPRAEKVAWTPCPRMSATLSGIYVSGQKKLNCSCHKTAWPSKVTFTHGYELKTFFSQWSSERFPNSRMLIAWANTTAGMIAFGSSSRIARFKMLHSSVVPWRLALDPDKVKVNAIHIRYSNSV